jgi:hypothetical protein
MQSKWKTCPQHPKAIERPFSLFGLGLAWYSIDGSFREFRQMAQVSAQMSQLHLKERVESCMFWGQIADSGSTREIQSSMQKQR